MEAGGQDHLVEHLAFAGAEHLCSFDEPLRHTLHAEQGVDEDGKEGTDDDIIMRDGVCYTNAEIKKQPTIRTSSDR